MRQKTQHRSIKRERWNRKMEQPCPEKARTLATLAELKPPETKFLETQILIRLRKETKGAPIRRKPGEGDLITRAKKEEGGGYIKVP